MSYPLAKNTHYGLRGLETNWVNIIFQTHDQFCGCDDTWKHLDHIRQQQCHRSEEPTAGTSTEIAQEDGFGFGDLELLFAEEEGEPVEDSG